MLALIQEALKAGTTLGFPLNRMIAHAETAVDDWKSGNEWVEYEMPSTTCCRITTTR
jgi:hypothetical protein